MSLLKNLIKSTANLAGFDIVRMHPGSNPYDDMRKFLVSNNPMIFDVGSNVGQSIEVYRTQFPDSTIHSFEPSPSTFQKLETRSSRFENVHLRNFALGASSGKLPFLENTRSTMSSFLPLSEFGWGQIEKKTTVDVKTIDQYCIEENIEAIDILKIDTQGYELEVLIGAERSIRDCKIGLVYLEVIFSDMYKNLPSFTEICDFLIRNDFLLVSFYQFYYQRQLASWSDALFVHKSLYTLGKHV